MSERDESDRDPGAADATNVGRARQDPLGEADGKLIEDSELRSCPRVEQDGKMLPTLGGYVLRRKVGSGGMGRVFIGAAPDSLTPVAVKVLKRSTGEDSVVVERFWREARHAARLTSPHLVAVKAIGKEPLHHIVMEYVNGADAEEWLRLRSGSDCPGAPEDEALDVCIAATKGLAVAHAGGVLHRDVKPANILVPVDEDGEPLPREAKLADLGLARMESGADAVTRGAGFMGTPPYTAPEQVGGQAGKPADVFAMGATLYKLLAGTVAQERVSDTNRASSDPVWIRSRRADLTEVTAQLIECCLDVTPERRFADATQLLAALECVRSDARRASWTPEQAAEVLRGFSRPAESPAEPQAAGASSAPDLEARSAREAPARASAPPSGPAPDAPARGWIWVALVSVAVVVALWASRDGTRGDAGCALRITTSPPGALVLVDGKPHGTTPLELLDLDEGMHAVRLELEYHDPHSWHGRLTATVPALISHTFSRRSGTLRMVGGASGARVRLLRRGATPREYDLRLDASGSLRAQAVESGEYAVDVEQPGLEPYTTVVEIRAAAQSVVDVGGAAVSTGFIDLTGLPEDVTVRIDGRPSTGLVSTSVGTHTVDLARAGFAPVAESVSVDAGRTVRIDVPEWKPNEPAVSPDDLRGIVLIHRSRGALGDATILVRSLVASLEEQPLPSITRSSRAVGTAASFDAGLEQTLTQIGRKLGRRLVVFLDVEATATEPVVAAGIRLQSARCAIQGTLVDAGSGTTCASVDTPAASATGHDEQAAARAAIEKGGAPLVESLARSIRERAPK